VVGVRPRAFKAIRELPNRSVGKTGYTRPEDAGGIVSIVVMGVSCALGV
jgi:hypothetical protein